MTCVAKNNCNTTCVAMVEGDAQPFNPLDPISHEEADLLKRSVGRCVASPFEYPVSNLVSTEYSLKSQMGSFHGNKI